MELELLDCGQCAPLVGGHQCPVGDGGTTDAAGNRGRHFGIGQVDAGGLDRGLGGGHIGLGLLEGCIGIIIILLADRLDLHQFLIALRLEPHGPSLASARAWAALALAKAAW